MRRYIYVVTLTALAGLIVLKADAFRRLLDSCVALVRGVLALPGPDVPGR